MTLQLNSELTQAVPAAHTTFDKLADSAYIRLPLMKDLCRVSSALIWRGVKKLTRLPTFRLAR